MGSDVVDAETGSIRAFGQNTATMGKKLLEKSLSTVMELSDMRDLAISTGNYPEGDAAQRLCTRNANEVQQFFHDFHTTVRAIASASLVCADLYEKADSAGSAAFDAIPLGAVQYAFAAPGAKSPAALPPHITGKTLQDVADPFPAVTPASQYEELIDAKMFTGAQILTYRTRDGGERVVVTTPGGTTREEVYRKDGTLASRTLGSTSGDSTVSTDTTYYDKNENVTGTTKQTSTIEDTPSKTHETRAVTETDANGKTTVTEHHEITWKYADGNESRQYYTIDPKGNVTDERTIGPQPPAMTAADRADRIDEMNEEARQLAPGQ